MDLENITHKIGNVFHHKSQKERHCQDILCLVEKLKTKEKTIRYKFEHEKDENKRKKHKLSLLVIQAQQSKAEKILSA